MNNLSDNSVARIQHVFVRKPQNQETRVLQPLLPSQVLLHAINVSLAIQFYDNFHCRATKIAKRALIEFELPPEFIAAFGIVYVTPKNSLSRR